MCPATMCLDFGGYCNLFWLGHLMRLDVDLVELRRMNWWTGVWVKPAEQVFCKYWAASIGPYSYLSSGLHLLLLKCCLWINRSESVQISTRPFLLNPQSCNLAASGPCSVYRPPLAALCLTMYIRRNWFHFREILYYTWYYISYISHSCTAIKKYIPQCIFYGPATPCNQRCLCLYQTYWHHFQEIL